MKLRVYNNTLDPNIWNEDKTLKPEIQDALLKIAQDFYSTSDLKSDIQNILFLGSCANYNWTPTSDIDLHVVIDIADEKIHEEYARKFMDGIAFKWNTEHDIEAKGHPVELYLQDVREPNSTPEQARPGAAIYSLFDGKWLLEPTQQKVDIDASKINKKYLTLKKKIQTLVDTQDIDKLKELMKSIRNYRDAGLADGGEFSVENLVFKVLRHVGDLKKIKDTITNVYDKKMSVPESGNMQPTSDTSPMKETKKYITEMVHPTGNYLIVGLVNPALEVVSEKDSNGGLSHADLVKNRKEFDSSKIQDLVFWRYKLSNNTLYWFHENANDDQKRVVLDHLHDKYGVNNPRQSFQPTAYTPDAYKIDEHLVNKHADLYLGFVNRENFKVIGTDVHDDSMTHGQWQQTLPDEYQWYWGTDCLPFRYKRSTNTVYWWGTFPDSTEEERTAVEDWLFKNANIKRPEHKMISWAKDRVSMERRITAHTSSDDGENYRYKGLDESTEDYKLYLGIVDDENYRLVVTPVTNDNIRMEHTVLAKMKGINFNNTKFRYRKDLNTVYWQYGTRPDDIHRDVVNDWINTTFNLQTPKHVVGTKTPEQVDLSHGVDLFFRETKQEKV